MPVRIIPIVNECLYHVTSTSIADLKVFNSDDDYKRMINTIRYYKIRNRRDSFSIYMSRQHRLKNKPSLEGNGSIKSYIVKLVAYCLMTTHIHLLLRQLEAGGISQFVGLILNSYAKYYNLKYGRKGAMWEGRFENILVNNDNQLLNVSRYIHLNPVTAYLANHPSEWKYSSFREYMNLVKDEDRICDFKDTIEIKDTKSYEDFCVSNIKLQRELALIKKQL